MTLTMKWQSCLPTTTNPIKTRADMKQIKATTMARAAAKAKDSEGPSHEEIMAEAANDTGTETVPHAERSGGLQEVVWPPEVNTYLPACPMDKIITIGQPRKRINDETCLELASSVNLYTPDGEPLYEQPITAWYWEEKDKLVVKHGHRRSHGASLEGWKTINLVVVEKQGKLERSFDQVVDNIHSEEMNPFDLGAQFKLWHDEGYSYSKIADRLKKAGNKGGSKTRVASYVTLAKMPQYIIDFGMLYLSDDVDAYVELNKLHKIDEKAAARVIDVAIDSEHFNRKVASEALKHAKKMKNLENPKVVQPNYQDFVDYSVQSSTTRTLNNTMNKLAKDGHDETPIVIKDKDGILRKLTKLKVITDEGKPQIIFEMEH
mgnify:CR=1 FL=1